MYVIKIWSGYYTDTWHDIAYVAEMTGAKPLSDRKEGNHSALPTLNMSPSTACHSWISFWIPILWAQCSLPRGKPAKLTSLFSIDHSHSFMKEWFRFSWFIQVVSSRFFISSLYFIINIRHRVFTVQFQLCLFCYKIHMYYFD